MLYIRKLFLDLHCYRHARLPFLRQAYQSPAHSGHGNSTAGRSHRWAQSVKAAFMLYLCHSVVITQITLKTNSTQTYNNICMLYRVQNLCAHCSELNAVLYFSRIFQPYPSLSGYVSVLSIKLLLLSLMSALASFLDFCV